MARLLVAVPMIQYKPMRVSIIIPTLNAGATIGNLLSALLSQEMKPSEIIIVDSSSEDDTADKAERYGASTIIIRRNSFNHGKTRNMAAMESQGDILVFMTQDALPFDNTLLSKLTSPLHVPDIAATFGRHIPGADASPLEVFARHFNYPDKGSVKGIEDIKRYGIKTFFFSNVCSSVKKEMFLKVGMFPEGIRANEDMLLAAKIISHGYKVAYVPEAVVIHSHNYSLLKQFKRYYNIGLSLKNNAWILKDIKAEAEGIQFVKEQLRFVMRQHKYLWIPYIFLETITKYAGFRIGLIRG